MIKINPSNVRPLAEKIMQNETKSIKFIQKQGDNILCRFGYEFGNNSDAKLIKELAVSKLQKAANLPEQCGEIFVTIA